MGLFGMQQHEVAKVLEIERGKILNGTESKLLTYQTRNVQQLAVITSSVMAGISVGIADYSCVCTNAWSLLIIQHIAGS